MTEPRRKVTIWITEAQYEMMIVKIIVNGKQMSSMSAYVRSLINADNDMWLDDEGNPKIEERR